MKITKLLLQNYPRFADLNISFESDNDNKTNVFIGNNGADGCNAIIQGSMKKYGVIEDAGLVVQPKKVTASEPEEV